MTSSVPECLRASSEKRVHGFTLLELIISLTITSLIVLVLYTAFSTGVRVWERQGDGTEEVRREEIMLRLLHDDFAAMRPYTMLWERGSFFFFAAGQEFLFYVTGNGFGARIRADKQLFFTCLFLDTDEEGNLGLFLYKVGVPEPDLVREAQDYRNTAEGLHGLHAPPEWLRQGAVRIASGFSNARFSFSGDAFMSFGGPLQENAAQGLSATEPEVLDQEFWGEDAFPGQVQLHYAYGDQEPSRILLLPQWGRP